MSDSAGSAPAPPLKKKGMKPMMIAAIAIVVVVALVAVIVLGGFLNPSSAAPKNALEKIQQRGKLIVGTNVPWPPFEDYNISSGKYEGIDMEIVQHIADHLGVTLEIKPMEFDALIGAVQTGQIDIAISSFTIRPDREESIDFSVPYYIANQAVLVHEDSTISTVDDLAGKTLGAQLGTTGAYWIQEELVDKQLTPQSSFTTYDSIIAAVLVVENGQKHAAVLDTPVAYKYANDTAYSLKVGLVIPTNEQYGICCPEEEPELLEAVNTVINQIKADGTLDQIILKWV